jgi:twinkle protein
MTIPELDDGILEEIKSQNQSGRIVCPSCGPHRKKKYEKTMSISVDPECILYNCWHCALSGRIEREPFYHQYMAPAQVAQIPTALNDSTQKIKTFWESRGVTLGSLDDYPPMITGTPWYRGAKAELESIGFVYGDPEEPEAIKWRPLDHKEFTQSGAARSFYGLAQLGPNPDMLIIVEGEPDVIALASLGIKAVSVPNGAPKNVSKGRVTPDEDKKFSYLWEARDLIEKVDKVVLAVDMDEPGEALAEEIARRIGRAKCWRAEYGSGCKDVGELLQEKGKEAVLESIEQAKAMPLHGVYGAKEYADEVAEIYLRGHGKGESTGIDSVDNLFTVAPGQLSVVTGLPNSGKSEFVDQVLVNLAMEAGWKFAVCSFENQPATHIAKLAEKVVGKPFYEGNRARMTRMELDDAEAFLADHFVFLDSKDGAVSTVDSIIDRAKQAVMRLGVRGLIIDPYNYVEMEAEREDKGISNMLTKITSFAQAHELHVWFVAHPKSIAPRPDGTFPVPTGMHISGGVTWFAKADVGITVHRGSTGVEIHCWKVRHKWVGQQGTAFVDYDVPTGRYSDYALGAPVAALPTTGNPNADLSAGADL